MRERPYPNRGQPRTQTRADECASPSGHQDEDERERAVRSAADHGDGEGEDEGLFAEVPERRLRRESADRAVPPQLTHALARLGERAGTGGRRGGLVDRTPRSSSAEISRETALIRFATGAVTACTSAPPTPLPPMSMADSVAVTLAFASGSCSPHRRRARTGRLAELRCWWRRPFSSVRPP